jgi:hypothetical protein
MTPERKRRHFAIAACTSSHKAVPVECGIGAGESVLAFPRLSREQEADALINGVGVAN